MVEFIDKNSEYYNKNELKSILNELDSSFMPLLSERVNIDNYVDKLDMYANIILVHNADYKLVGIAAFYDNNIQTKNAHITILGIIPEYQGKGLATKLLQRCFKECKKKGMEYVTLETWELNDKGLNLYKKFGFSIEKSESGQGSNNNLLLKKRL